MKIVIKNGIETCFYKGVQYPSFKVALQEVCMLIIIEELNELQRTGAIA